MASSEACNQKERPVRVYQGIGVARLPQQHGAGESVRAALEGATPRPDRLHKGSNSVSDPPEKLHANPTKVPRKRTPLEEKREKKKKKKK